mmetsp:Transcript_16804/g.18685  ORF Transcript_16804/g.18685 Transcript_16804/m.18685 type:complete len:82 (-) Transcript_16804:101-346(-)
MVSFETKSLVTSSICSVIRLSSSMNDEEDNEEPEPTVIESSFDKSIPKGRFCSLDSSVSLDNLFLFERSPTEQSLRTMNNC